MVTDKQVRRLLVLVKTDGKSGNCGGEGGDGCEDGAQVSAAGTGTEQLPAAPRWRTRPDAFAEVWAEIRELLEVNAGLEAKTVFEYLQRRCPAVFEDGQLRTLQRRVKSWRATEGPAKEVFFAQQHSPGRLGASRLHAYRGTGHHDPEAEFPSLNLSLHTNILKLRSRTVCYSESFESLCERFQNAL